MASLRPLILTPLFSLAALLSMPQLACAQNSQVYAGVAIEVIGLNAFDSDGVQFFPENSENIAFRGGVILHKYFAIEGEAVVGIGNQDGDGIAGYESRFGGYGRVRYPFDDSGLEVFARLGYAASTIDSFSIGGQDTLDGIALGGGLAWNFGKDDRFQLRADYSRFNFGNNLNSNAASLGIGYNF